MAPISDRAHATQRASAPRAHPPPWASSPDRCRAAPVSPGKGSDACVVSRRFHCCHFEPMAALLARNPLRIHPETLHFPYPGKFFTFFEVAVFPPTSKFNVVVEERAGGRGRARVAQVRAWTEAGSHLNRLPPRLLLVAVGLCRIQSLIAH
jgi:hypothetical protein